MKLILSLSLLLVCFPACGATKSPKMDEFVSTLYKKASEKATSFFQTTGTPVVDYVHPSLRTESDPVLHERATAHFEYYKDDQCAEREFILDLKINRCGNYLGNVVVTLLSEVGSNWMLSLQYYDGACENTEGDPVMKIYEKNVCTPLDGAYVKFNLIGHPQKSIPGGGGAVVFYENENDCQISKHTNLARANMMITWSFDVCSSGFLGYVKAMSCDSDFYYFRIYSEATCDPITSGGFEIPTALDCSIDQPFFQPIQVLCIADSGHDENHTGVR
jgi:hypothetical protein